MKITFLEHKAAIERRANNVDNVYLCMQIVKLMCVVFKIPAV